ncbi:WD40 repeat protein [Spironucleus salmonicida]|uniref:WD40 domain-containing protein n=1 Tax=Spironucleus salmonicida TaxID=348837 RepID=V6LCP2_9EUKA|nr:WD40 repeat protein [Spironucleus salmonicida]|eukprot:EST42217.1 WD40 domain-containing protein [Spironucleus salmonicida]
MLSKSIVEEAAVKSAYVKYSDLQRETFNESYHFGVDTVRFQNLVYVNENTILFASGNALRSFSMLSQTLTTVPTDLPGGIICTAQTFDNQFVAVGYSGKTGYVRIFEIIAEQQENSFPVVLDKNVFFKLVTEIQDVALVGVDCLSFNHTNNLLAVVTSAPDYNLMIYEWRSAKLQLKAKAFTNSVFRIQFCKYTPEQLITGGKNHIKFWQMAATFTGFKLKGDLAKFGILDASDTVAFGELPCGNFISGQGTGELALWDFTSVRLVYRRSQTKQCHDGRIEFLQIDATDIWTTGNQQLVQTLELCGIPQQSDGWWEQVPEENTKGQDLKKPFPVIVTGGSDGYIRIWSGHEIMQSQFIEKEDASLYYDIQPVEEIFIGKGVIVRNIIFSTDKTTAIIQDAGLGGFIKMNIADRTFQRLYYGHAGPVKGIAFANSSTSLNPSNESCNQFKARSNLVATIGASGAVFLHDVISRKLVATKITAQLDATSCHFIHNTLCLVVGYEDGSVRLFSLFTEELDDQAELLSLITVYRCFKTAVTDITCSARGVITLINEQGQIFLIDTNLCLVRKEEKISAADQNQVKLNSMAQGLINVVVDGNQDEETKAATELARRNAKGKLGISSQDVHPICLIDCCKLIFGEETSKLLKFPIWIDETHISFVVSGDRKSDNRMVIVQVPAIEEIIQYRSSHPEQVLQSTLFGESEHSLISFDITDFIPKQNIKFVNVHVPPSQLPGTNEGTVAKIEQQVVSNKIQAMLPSKSALEDAMEALKQMGGGDDQKEEEEEEEELDDLGQPIEKDKKKKKKKLGILDPLDEDLKQSIQYDFQQVSVTRSDGFVSTTATEGQQLQILLEVFVDQDIQNRAKNAMDMVRARAEAAALGTTISTAGQDDPSLAMACLAVADLRAQYRSSILYTFSLQELIEYANSTIQSLTIQPKISTPIAMPENLIDVPLFTESIIEDDNYKIQNPISVKILIKKPLQTYAIALKNITEFCTSQTQKSSMQQYYESNYVPYGCLYSIIEGGDLVVQTFDKLEDFDQLNNESAKVQFLDRRYLFSIGQVQTGLNCLQIGFGGHCIGVGDNSGNMYCIFTNIFNKYIEQEIIESLEKHINGISYCYKQDTLWSTGNAVIQLNRAVQYKDEVISLLPVGSQIDKNAINQVLCEIEDFVQVKTIEETRLQALDAADNMRGADSKAGVQAKIDQLKLRYQAMLKENEQQSQSRRLQVHEISPDLQLTNGWIKREEARAFELLQNELGAVMNSTIEKIFNLQQAFPLIELPLSVSSFSSATTSVQSFRLVPLPNDFENQLCKGLGVGSLQELEELQNSTFANTLNQTMDTTMSKLNDTLGDSMMLSNNEDQLASQTVKHNQIQIKAPKSLRPVDKIVKQLLNEQKGIKTVNDDGASDFDTKKARIQQRAQQREERMSRYREILDRKPDPRSIHPDDSAVILQAQKTFGTFPLKMQDDYISIIQKLQEEQEKIAMLNPQDAIQINPGENREGKWLEFLFTLKGLQDAKKEFNSRVRVLFAHKQAVVKAVSMFKQEALRISALIKELVGPAIADELDAIQSEEINPDYIISFINLYPEEEKFVIKEKMMTSWNKFLADKQILEHVQQLNNDEDKIHIFFQQLQLELGDIFNSDEFNQFSLEFINTTLSARIITGDEANRLRQLLDCPKLTRKEIIAQAIEETSTIFSQEMIELPKEENSEVANNTSQDNSRLNSKNEARYEITQSPITHILQQILNSEIGTVQQLQSYDCFKLLNLYAKSPSSKQTKIHNQNLVKVLLSVRKLIYFKIASLAKTFDECLLEICSQQLFLQTDFCRIRIRLINLFQECEIHHLYVTKDAKSLNNLDKCRTDHLELSKQMEVLQKDILAKIIEAKGVSVQLATLQGQFDQNISKEFTFRTKLLKLYSKKFKPPKVKKQSIEQESKQDTGLDEFYDDEDESSQLSNLSEDDGGDDEIIDETVPPEGVSQEMFQFVLTLRDQKRLCDLQLLQIQQQADQLKQQHQQLQKREKSVLQSIDSANRELTSFRSNKQKELNAIQSSSLITISQYCSLLENNQINQNLDQSLIFDQSQLDKIYKRIEKRGLEIAALQKIGLQLKQQYAVSLAQEREEEKQLEVLNQKLVAVQNLKFGRTVDIAKLDGIAINDQAMEMQKVIDVEDKGHQKMLFRKDRQFDQQKEDFKLVVQENTKLVQELSRLEQEALDLDRVIIQGQKQPPKAWCSDNKQELVRQEYNNLKQAIVDRERELRGLVDEISLLKNHGSQ